MSRTAVRSIIPITTRAKSHFERVDLRVPRKARILLKFKGNSIEERLENYFTLLGSKAYKDSNTIKEQCFAMNEKVQSQVQSRARKVQFYMIPEKSSKSLTCKRGSLASSPPKVIIKRQTIGVSSERLANKRTIAEAIEETCNFLFGRKRKVQYDLNVGISQLRLDSGIKVKRASFLISNN